MTEEKDKFIIINKVLIDNSILTIYNGRISAKDARTLKSRIRNAVEQNHTSIYLDITEDHKVILSLKEFHNYRFYFNEYKENHNGNSN